MVVARGGGGVNPDFDEATPSIANLKLAHLSAMFGDLVREAHSELDDEELGAWIELASTVIARLNADRFEEKWNRG